jgi:hypothetical protein
MEFHSDTLTIYHYYPQNITGASDSDAGSPKPRLWKPSWDYLGCSQLTIGELEHGVFFSGFREAFPVKTTKRQQVELKGNRRIFVICEALSLQNCLAKKRVWLATFGGWISGVQSGKESETLPWGADFIHEDSLSTKQ